MDQQAHSQNLLKLDEEKQNLVVEYLPLVKFIAQRLRDHLPRHVDIEDIENVGTLGLMEALCRYDETQNNLFKTYAEYRIRGAILDDFRKNDWMTRTGREKHKLLTATLMNLEKEKKRPVTSEEMADILGMDVEAYFAFSNEAQAGVFLNIEDILQRKDMSDKEGSVFLSQAEKNIWTDQVKKMVAEEIDKLTREEHQVVSLYYHDEFTLKEIGYVMERTESRICQIHHEAMKKLSRRLHKRIKEPL
jgi:RNA polymerase sigma factor for flagellar operon FliA